MLYNLHGVKMTEAERLAKNGRINYGSPNFKFPNEALFELCDKLSFDVFVSRCVKKF